MTPDAESGAAVPQPWSEPTLSQPVDELVEEHPDASQPPPPVPGRPRMKYDEGRVAPWHPKLIEHAADVAVAAMPIPLRVLDVGCGEGALLAELILRVPHANLYVGADPRPGVISAQQRAAEPRLCVVRAAAEALPFADACFDLVVATMSFAFWADQRAGARELARVVGDNGKVVLVEATHPEPHGRHRARTDKQIIEVLETAGLQIEATEVLHYSLLRRPLARAFIACL